MDSVLHWKAASAYPVATIPGIGLARFSEEVFRATNARIQVDCCFGIKKSTPEILKDVCSGSVPLGDLYCGSLSSVDSIFGLGSLPFLSTSPEQSLELLLRARRMFEVRFNDLGAHLLYVSPWPPTGLWSSRDIRVAESFRTLRIRAYDPLSTSLIASAGGSATHLSIGDALLNIKNGSLDAVLSSGDGAAGKEFMKVLPFFFDIRYAAPWSFFVVEKMIYDGLATDMKVIVDEVASRVEKELWTLISKRMQANRNEMIAHGVKVRSCLPSEIGDKLLQQARVSVEQWKDTVGGEAAGVLEAYLSS